MSEHMQQKQELSLEELQNIELALLKWLHRFCLRHKLRYYMSGGTLLGAVRHHGFIPWDDDVDVHMPRKDFNQLLLLQKEFPPSVCLYYLGNPDSYPHPFGKLVAARTTAIEEHMPTQILGVYLDIFPIDGVPENPKVQEKIEHELGVLEKQLDYSYFLPHHDLPAKNPLVYHLKKWYYGQTQNLTPTYYRQKYDELLAYDFDDSREVKNFTCYKCSSKEQVPRSFYGNPTLMPFEDSKFFGFERADAYLTRFYGDYMTLPPTEKRWCHHLHAYCLAGHQVKDIMEELAHD